jgi:hypothetical protein
LLGRRKLANTRAIGPQNVQPLGIDERAMSQIQEEAKSPGKTLPFDYVALKTVYAPKWKWPVKRSEETPFDAARAERLIAESGSKHYAGYARYCTGLGINPIPIEQWRALEKQYTSRYLPK